MMVVLVLLGIVAAMVTTRLAPDDRRDVEHEATRIAGTLEHAIAAAQWRGETLGVSAEGRALRFWRRDGDDAWSVLTDDEALAARTPPAPLEVQAVRYATANVAPNAILPLRASGRNEPLELLVRGNRFDAHVTSDTLNRVRLSVAARPG